MLHNFSTFFSQRVRTRRYHRRSVAETAMYRIKTLLSGHLSLRDYDAQAGEAMAMVKALNWMTLLGTPHIVRIA